MEVIAVRFQTLLEEGERLVSHLPLTGGSRDRVVPTQRVPQYQAWLMSVANLLQVVALPDSYFIEECNRILSDSELKYGIPSRIVQKMYGILQSAKREWNEGLLRRIEYMVAASTFDEFLGHAAIYHRAGKKIEAAVLASAVLEDTVKRIAKKNQLPISGQSLDELINALAKAGILTQVKAKRVKGYAGVRNAALHADWDSFDIRDVGGQINGLRELIAEYL